MERKPIHSFLSFPNYYPTIRSNEVLYWGKYKTTDDIIKMLYTLKFPSNYIHDMYSEFHESNYLTEVLQNVRACVIQIKPSWCNIDKVCVLENKMFPISERVVYIRMYDYTGGKRTKCNKIQVALFMFILGLFAITGIALSLWRMFEMITS